MHRLVHGHANITGVWIYGFVACKFSIVSVDKRGGLTVIALDAVNCPLTFVPGRFGFYNYSQPNTAYGNICAMERRL